jgi:hypothetical protein
MHIHWTIPDKALTPAMRELKRLLNGKPIPRMLTPSEIELLRQSKQEIARKVAESK